MLKTNFSTVISHLDYANSMLAGLPSSSIKIIQKVQKHSARLILGKCHGKHHRMPQSPTLSTNTTEDKLQICTLIHKCQNKQAPVYLQNIIQEKTANCPGFRLGNKKALLAVQNIRKQAFTSISFSVYGLMLWNPLPDTIREEIIFEKFKIKLKTHLFTTVYM